VMGNLIHQPQHPPEPEKFWLRNLWRRLRPSLSQPEAGPVA
jgi:hypothetical protein